MHNKKQRPNHYFEGPFSEIERLRLADGIPLMKEARYISLRLRPDIQRKRWKFIAVTCIASPRRPNREIDLTRR